MKNRMARAVILFFSLCCALSASPSVDPVNPEDQSSPEGSTHATSSSTQQRQQQQQQPTDPSLMATKQSPPSKLPKSNSQQGQNIDQENENKDDDDELIPGVIELTTINLDSNIRKGGVWVIEFYAPWCSACNHFAGTYARLAYTIHAKNYIQSKQKQQQQQHRERPIHVAKINGDKERASASRFNIDSYPSIYVVDGWNVYQYKGYRSEEALLDYIVGERYKNQNPLPIWSSPMGPLGQTQAFIFFVGHAFFGLYNYLVLNQGFSHTTAAFLFAFGGMATGLVTMILVAILMSGKVKED